MDKSTELKLLLFLKGAENFRKHKINMYSLARDKNLRYEMSPCK